MKLKYKIQQKLVLLLALWCMALGAIAQVTLNAPTAGGQSNYQWFEGTAAAASPLGGETNSSLITSTPGVYFATYDVEGCGGATEYFVLVDGCDMDALVTLNVGDNSGTYEWFKDGVSTGETTASIQVEATDTEATYFAQTTSGDCTSDLPGFTLLNLQDCNTTDLTPGITILPSVIVGTTNQESRITVTEINGFDTDGSGIFVSIPTSSLYSVGTYDPAATTSLGLTVQNSKWTYVGIVGGNYFWQYGGTEGVSVLAANTTTAIGFPITFNPGFSSGSQEIVVTIFDNSGGETRIDNNRDGETIDYSGN